MSSANQKHLTYNRTKLKIILKNKGWVQQQKTPWWQTLCKKVEEVRFLTPT